MRLSLSVALLVTAFASRAPAAACCTSATSFGVGRLLAWEQGAAGLQITYARSLGLYGADGMLRTNASDFSDGLAQAMPWTIVRVAPRVQLQAWAPVLVNDRVSGEASQVAGGLGDVGGAARIDLATIGEYEGLPGLALTLGVTAPTGRRVEETSAPLFAGTTGRGVWAGGLAAELEYAFLPWFFRLEGGVGASLPFTRSDTGATQRYAPTTFAAGSTGLEVVPDRVVLALALRGDWEGPIRIEGAEVARSSARLVTATLSAAVRPSPHWTIVAAATNTVWPDELGANRDARLGGNLGIRYGFF